MIRLLERIVTTSPSHELALFARHEGDFAVQLNGLFIALFVRHEDASLFLKTKAAGLAQKKG